MQNSLYVTTRKSSSSEQSMGGSRCWEGIDRESRTPGKSHVANHSLEILVGTP